VLRKNDEAGIKSELGTCCIIIIISCGYSADIYFICLLADIKSFIASKVQLL